MKKLAVIVVIAILGAGYYFLIMKGTELYMNDELGYSVEVPKGWVASGPSPIDASRSVFFAPQGISEEQDATKYFSVAIDQRTTAEIKSRMPVEIQSSATTIDGNPATLFFLVTPGTQEILVEHAGKTYWLGPFDSAKPEVNEMISSFRFTQ